MVQAPRWRQLIDNGRQLTDEGASYTRRLTSRLAAQGEQTTSEVSAKVEALVAHGRRRGDDLQAVGRAAVEHHLDALAHARKSAFNAIAYRLFGGRGREPSR